MAKHRKLLVEVRSPEYTFKVENTSGACIQPFRDCLDLITGYWAARNNNKESHSANAGDIPMVRTGVCQQTWQPLEVNR